MDAKIGYTFLQMAAQFKPAYESYAKTNPKFIQMINKQKLEISEDCYGFSY
jgi:hypothetical protein